MRKIAALSMFLASTGCAPEPAYPYDVTSDSGGVVDVYALVAKYVTEPIRIVGVCASSCTQLLAAKNVCVGHDSAFMFHAAHYTIDDSPNAFMWKSVSGTKTLASHYSKPLLAFIAREGGLKIDKEIWITGEQLIAMGYKACN